MPYNELNAALAAHLIAWHGAQQRDLPWRNAPAGTRDPYTVWISEIMAQQTRVETVSDYYVRWLAAFPTIAALAAADQQAVLKLWEGLGYYARARNLHKAAQIVIAEHSGILPDRRDALLALPGIGEYTAGAILSLAFNQHAPILDGNVKRVISRLADIDAPINQPATVQILWEKARAIVEAAPPGCAGACNEALMELGAVICTPTKPRCLICPLANYCVAAANGTQTARPVMPERKRTPHYDVTAAIIWQGDRFASPLLIAQRPAAGMLGGLWEFPGGKREAEDDSLEACLVREIAEELAIEIAVGEQITTVKHAYTHFRITLHAFHACHVSGDPQPIGCDAWRWITLPELLHEEHGYPFPVTDQKIIQALGAAAAEE